MGNLPTPPKAGRSTAKRSEEKLGNSHGQRDRKPKVIEATRTEYTPPEPDPDWGPAATRWYQSLPLSAFSNLYEPSDWETAWFLAKYLNDLTKRPSAHGLAALMSGMGELMVTEASRRRAKVEIMYPDPDEAQQQQARIINIQDRLKGTSSGRVRAV